MTSIESNESVAHFAGTSKAALSVREFCATVSIGRTTFYKQVNAGLLRVIKVGTRTLVLTSEMNRWLNAAAVGGEAV